MRRMGILRLVGAALGSAALLAALSACSGGAQGEVADGGIYSAERPRPADSGGTAAAESSRPEADPAQTAGSGADEQSRPPEQSDGGEAEPSERGRPDESDAEPGTGAGLADEQSRPEGEAAESADEVAREDASDPAERSAAGSAADERSRPSDAGDAESEATDSSEGSSASEQNRPVDKSNDKTPQNKDQSVNKENQRPSDSGTRTTENPSTDEQQPANQEQQRPEDKSSNDSSNKSAQDKAKEPQTDEKNRPVQAPKWNGPDQSSEQSRTDGSFSGSGHYLVTEHLRPGLYRSIGNIEYWERTSGKSGTEKDRIVRAEPVGPAVAEIKSSDVGFISKGSGTWKPVSGKTGAFKTEFGAGTYIVGVDIEPGRYRSPIGATRWETLSGFGGEKSDQLRGASPGKSAPVTVEIKATDRGFTSSGALWMKVE
ncbi:hypothetical protein [Saccharibacillus sacchari]|uniref:hypothetical protein n=1 Tax=Saccharibacillus sacchari TaxID=456493 RepID=UPI0004B457F8|nr:hypothetical protein [Saccharibacillus sacchari]